MVRIGGKGMTRERDRIQENANKYIAKNCPALQQTYYCDTHHSKCQDCTDCVIKQVIDRCNKDKIHKYDYKVSKDILDLFDIEEIRK